MPSGAAHAGRTASRSREPLREWDAVRHATLDSTNLEARRLLASGCSRKTVIVADAQTNGQCRHDRLWESRPGKGLWASFILPVSPPSGLLSQSTLVLAVAARDAVFSATGVSLAIKWPNDLLGGDGKKCCGLLVEAGEAREPHGPIPLILGVGINRSHAVDDFPPYLRDAATSLHLLAGGETADCETLLRAVAASILHWFSVWEKHGFPPVRDAWLAGNRTTGRRVLLPDGYGYPHATAEGLDETGALLALADDGTCLRIDSGEVRFIDSGSGAV